MPKEELAAIEESEEIYNFMMQSHISKRNVTRLKILAASPIPLTADLARIVLDVARVKPYKKKRAAYLARNHRDILEKCEETGLIALFSE